MSTLFEPQKVVFTAMSKRSFYLREFIIKHTLRQGYTPFSAFMMFSYFLLDTVERDQLISANNELIRRSDELWVFGPVSDGVLEEILFAKKLRQRVTYFKFDKLTHTFSKIPSSEVEFEPDTEHYALPLE
jgi:hypothetical protein